MTKYTYSKEQGGGPKTDTVVEERSYRKMEDPSTRVHFGVRWNGIKYVPCTWETKETKKPTGYR